MTRRPYLGDRSPGRFWVLGFVLVAFLAGSVKIFQRGPRPKFQAGVAASALPIDRSPEIPSGLGGWSGVRSEFVSKRKLVRTHAACLIELENRKVRAFWYAGTDEGTADVTIQTAVLDPDTGSWTPERMVVSRETTQQALFRYVKKVGNPVVSRAADGSMTLFYVAVSLGGWSGSSITAMTSQDDGETWSQPRRLITSPFFNLGTLVKAQPFAYADGTIGLPVHAEFLGKFGEVLNLDAANNVVDSTRLSSGRSCLQPVFLVEGENRAVVLMRYAGKERPNRVISTRTSDGGLTWTPPEKLMLANPNSALSGLMLPDGRILAALNNNEDNRDALSLVVSDDGGTRWKTIYVVEDKSEPDWKNPSDNRYSSAIEALAVATNGGTVEAVGYADSVKRLMGSSKGWSFEFSYPCLIRTKLGEFHLVYTWNEAFIKHVQFSQAWLDRRMAETK
jgi:hypothetical protein